MKQTFCLLIATVAAVVSVNCRQLTPINPADTIVISAKHPVAVSDTAMRKALSRRWEEYGKMSPSKIKAHPSADMFPGKVDADAPRITRTVAISHSPVADSVRHIVENLHFSGRYSDVMYSTGLYAAPGEVIEVRTSKELAKCGAKVRIGAHTDHLDYWIANEQPWVRLPLLTIDKPIEGTVTKIASPVGGLIYIDCSPKDSAFEGEFTISGAVAAPYFVLGKTTDKQWSEMMSSSAAPWGEVEADGIILTIPTDSLRHLQNPADKVGVWDKVVGACYDLAQIPTPFYRKQRIVPDVQISGGYMHSGYPIMAQAVACKILGNPDLLLTESGWGFFHEIGHNMQNAVDWVYAGSTEVSVNLFTLYVFDKVIHGRDGAHSAIGQVETTRKIERYFDKGADFEEWKRDPFVGLITLRQLQEDFGWETFKKAFRKFQQDDKQNFGHRIRESREQSDQRKMDNFVVYMSQAAERDLTPFFKVWGFPLSDSVGVATSQYKPWMPYNFPPSVKLYRAPARHKR